MKFSAVFGLVAAGLASVASAAPTNPKHHHGSGSSSVVAIEEATIFVQENTNNYYITFEEVELVEIVEVSHDSRIQSPSGGWDKSHSRYGSHVSIEESIVLVEVQTNKRYHSSSTIEIAEYISVSESSSHHGSRSVEARGGHGGHHNTQTETITIAVSEEFSYHGQTYKVVEAVEVEVVIESSSHKREALAMPGSHGHNNGNKCRQTTITLDVNEELIYRNTHYKIETDVSVEVKVIVNGCS